MHMYLNFIFKTNLIFYRNSFLHICLKVWLYHQLSVIIISFSFLLYLCRLLTSLPKYTQHLLVLLFGTFRVIASNAAHAGTGMTSEALGVSVAPSFFQSCVSDGKTARMEDVLKFKVNRHFRTKLQKILYIRFCLSFSCFRWLQKLWNTLSISLLHTICLVVRIMNTMPGSQAAY